MTLEEIYELIIDQNFQKREGDLDKQVLYSYHLLNACGFYDVADFLYGQFFTGKRYAEPLDEGYG